MTCTECNRAHPWYASACGAPVEYSAADRELQALLQGPERDQILSHILDTYLELVSQPRSGGPRENVGRWIKDRHIGRIGPAEATKSYSAWCRENNQEIVDMRDFVEEYERITGHPLSGFLIA